MRQQFPVTAQMVIKDEERFVWFAVQAVLPFVKQFLITDTGSTDKTWRILKSIKNQKIILKKEKKSVVKVRQSQLQQTKTPWFLLVDGDEIWPEKELKKLLRLTKKLSRGRIAVVNKTRNCAGDVWHYLPKKTGKYRFGKWHGHLNIRLMRTLPYEIRGEYPLEEYQFQGKSVNLMASRLAYSSAWYLHASHVKRTESQAAVSGRRYQLVEKGIKMERNQLPEVFFKDRPASIPDPLKPRSLFYELKSNLIRPFKWIKRKVGG